MSKIININFLKQKLHAFLFSRKIIIVFALLLISLILIITPNTASAESRVKMVKSVTVVQIEKGDTVWSIAKEYYTGECGRLTDYVREIKKSNGLSKDTIFAGSYLIVPYYVQN